MNYSVIAYLMLLSLAVDTGYDIHSLIILTYTWLETSSLLFIIASNNQATKTEIPIQRGYILIMC